MRIAWAWAKTLTDVGEIAFIVTSKMVEITKELNYGFQQTN